MTIGAAIFLLVVGAILKFAVSDGIEGIDLSTIGLILMIAGAAGLALGLVLMQRGRPLDEPIDRPVDRPVDRY